MIRIRILDGSGKTLGESAHASEALLCLDRVWEQGDSVVFSAPAGAHLMIQMESPSLSGEVFLPGGVMHWPVPFGEERLAYAPEAFAGKRHALSARLLSPKELSLCRDVARNPLDLRGNTDFYPHCTANVETRNEAVFAARNVIDGLRFNDYHGEWPYESWGIGARTDAWCLLDFGRDIIADAMALTLRADFPHDAYWTEGRAMDSNGEEIRFFLEKTGERQWISLGGRKIRSLRLERMVKSDDPSAFPSLRAWEVFGWEAEKGGEA